MIDYVLETEFKLKTLILFVKLHSSGLYIAVKPHLIEFISKYVASDNSKLKQQLIYIYNRDLEYVLLSEFTLAILENTSVPRSADVLDFVKIFTDDNILAMCKREQWRKDEEMLRHIIAAPDAFNPFTAVKFLRQIQNNYQCIDIDSYNQILNYLLNKIP